MRPNRLLKRLFATGTLLADGHTFWCTLRRFLAFHE